MKFGNSGLFVSDLWYCAAAPGIVFTNVAWLSQTDSAKFELADVDSCRDIRMVTVRGL